MSDFDFNPSEGDSYSDRLAQKNDERLDSIVKWLWGGVAVIGIVCSLVLLRVLHLRTDDEMDAAKSSGKPQLHKVRASDNPSTWPLEVEFGFVWCDGHALIFRDPSKKDWALNGVALSRGYPEIEPIWKWREDGVRARMDISPIKDFAIQKCETFSKPD